MNVRRPIETGRILRISLTITTSEMRIVGNRGRPRKKTAIAECLQLKTMSLCSRLNLIVIHSFPSAFISGHCRADLRDARWIRTDVCSSVPLKSKREIGPMVDAINVNRTHFDLFHHQWIIVDLNWHKSRIKHFWFLTRMKDIDASAKRQFQMRK